MLVTRSGWRREMRDALNHLKQRAFLGEVGNLIGDVALVPGDARQIVVRRGIEPKAGDATGSA